MIADTTWRRCIVRLYECCFTPDVLQDAHEFLNYLLNECSELLEKEGKAKRAAEGPSAAENNADSSSQAEWLRQQQESGQSAESIGAEVAAPKKAVPPPTWIHKLFQVGIRLN